MDNLLDLIAAPGGQRREPRPDWCSVDEVVQRGHRDRSPAPPGGFDVQLDPDLPLVRADAAQLERAFANVLENAARFAGDEPVPVRAPARRTV